MDYATGVDDATLWNSVPENNPAFQFRWFGGTTSVATLSGVGDLTITGRLTVPGQTLIRAWVAFEVRASTGTVSIFSTSGSNDVTAANVVRTAAGSYAVSVPLHPYGSNFVPVVTSRCGDPDFRYATVRFVTATATESKFVVNIRNAAATPALVDGDFFFHTVP